MLTNRLELLSSRRNGDYGDALPLSYVSIIQKCLHPLIVFEFCYSLHLCITSRLGQKRLCNYERGAFISYHSLVCRDKAERWTQTTLLPHETLCAHLGSQQTVRLVSTAIANIGNCPHKYWTTPGYLASSLHIRIKD